MVVPALAVCAALGLAACGGSSKPAAAGAAAARGGFRGPFASLTATQRSCLAKAGINFGARPRNGQPPIGGQPPSGARRPRTGQPPAGGFRNGTRFKKLQAAFKKCGVKFPAGRGPGAGPPGVPPGQTGTTQN